MSIRLGAFIGLAVLAAAAIPLVMATPPPDETAYLYIARDNSGGIVLNSSPLRFTGYRLEQSSDLVQWAPTEYTFDPACTTHHLELTGEMQLSFRLQVDTSLALRSLDADATTIQLHCLPISAAAEYRVYRDGTYIGSTVGRTGHYLDSGLTPNQTYNYYVRAFDSIGDPLGQSATRTFATTTSGRVRNHYKVLVLAFYPDVVNLGELAHIRTYLKHRIDFIRLASVNSAILAPYQEDVICVHASPPIFNATGFNIDYARLAVTPYPELNGYSIVDLVEKGEADAVWVARAPEGYGFYENHLIGTKDLNPNSSGEHWNPTLVKCSRGFFVNSYVADARSYDAYVHMVEGIMSTIVDGYLNTWPRTYPYVVLSRTRTDSVTAVTNLNLFERFRLADEWGGTGSYASRGNANCGTSHFPPNARRDVDEGYNGDYAYYDLKTWQRYVDCGADDWLRYPNGSGETRKLNGYDFGAFNHYLENEPAYGAAWGASPEKHPSFRFGTASYHQWWFNHLPHNAGVTGGKLNNWWSYIFDFNRFNGGTITNPVEGFLERPFTFPPIQEEYGTESATADWWGYWHSDTDFGPSGRISVVSNTPSPGVVRKGRYAIKVEVAEEWFHYNGRNDAIYPITRDAHWELSALRRISLAIKLDQNPGQISGVNPVIRLCGNGGNRIELVPLTNGRYANFLTDPAFRDPDGWFVFDIPIGGGENWESNVIGYVDPSLNPSEVLLAKGQLIQAILADVNYLEISLHSDGNRGSSVSYYLDDIEFHSNDDN